MATLGAVRDRWKSLPEPVRLVVQVAVAVGVAAALLAPNVADVGRALDAVGSVDLPRVLVGVALQAGAVVCLALVTRSALPPSARPSVVSMTRIELSAMAASHTIPAGTAAGTALGFRVLDRAGVGKPDAGFAVGARGIGASLVLNVLLWGALAVSIPLRGLDPVYSLIAVVGLVVLGGSGVLAFLLVRRPPATTRRLEELAGRLPLVERRTVARGLEFLGERLGALAADRTMLLGVVGWSAGYWLLQAGSLAVFVSAFGETPRPDILFVAFGIGSLVAFIPITPRGLGTFEATVITLLGTLGVDRSTALLGVLGWRLVSFWLPIPVGALAYLSLRAVPPGR